MLFALLVLIGCQLIGELAREAFHLTLPGPVIGMFLLAAILVIRGGKRQRPLPPDLEKTGEALIASMGLLFVPAGVGVVAEADLLRQEWLPIVVALCVSTILSTAVTGGVMHFMMNRPKRPSVDATLPQGLGEPSHD